MKFVILNGNYFYIVFEEPYGDDFNKTCEQWCGANQFIHKNTTNFTIYSSGYPEGKYETGGLEVC